MCALGCNLAECCSPTKGMFSFKHEQTVASKSRRVAQSESWQGAADMLVSASVSSLAGPMASCMLEEPRLYCGCVRLGISASAGCGVVCLSFSGQGNV